MQSKQASKDIFCALNENLSREFETQESMEHGKRTHYLAKHLATTQTEAYNPDQDKLEVLEIRRTYAHLRDELVKNTRELVQADSDKLSELIDQSNAVFSRGNVINIS